MVLTDISLVEFIHYFKGPFYISEGKIPWMHQILMVGIGHMKLEVINPFIPTTVNQFPGNFSLIVVLMDQGFPYRGKTNIF